MKTTEKTIEVIVVPRASKTEIVAYLGTALKIRLKAPPVDGAANQELIRFLAKHFAVAPAKIRIVRGLNSKKKLIKLA